jgi:hypothetical protein
VKHTDNKQRNGKWPQVVFIHKEVQEEQNKQPAKQDCQIRSEMQSIIFLHIKPENNFNVKNTHCDQAAPGIYFYNEGIYEISKAANTDQSNSPAKEKSKSKYDDLDQYLIKAVGEAIVENIERRALVGEPGGRSLVGG